MIAKGRKGRIWIAQYWKQQAITLAEWSNDAPEEDLQDGRDYSCRPTDPQAATSQFPKKRKH